MRRADDQSCAISFARRPPKPTPRSWLGAIALLALCGALSGCGGNCRVSLSSGLVVGCGDVPPGPGDPSFGAQAEVLVEDTPTKKTLWIGIGDPDVYSTFRDLCGQAQLEWIGGRVIVATDHPLGFFFDPTDIVVATSAPGSVQTTLDQIHADPKFFTPTGAGGTAEWVVPATVLDVESPGGQQCRVETPTSSN